MKGGLYIAGAALCGALLANLLLADPGYVAARFAGHLVEMSAVTFLLLALAAYFLVRLVVRAVRARALWKRTQEDRRKARARNSLSQGVLELSAGEWEAAERTLTRNAHDAEHPAAHYLVAARTAELLNAPKRRDEWLRRALESAGDRRAPVLIMKAEIDLKHKQLEAARETLEQLEATSEQNAHGLLLLARVLRQRGQWQQLQALESRLRSTRGITAATADETVVQIYLDRLSAAGRSEDADQLHAVWKEIPRSLAQRPDVAVTYARAAMACDQPAAAEGELRAAIERQWDEAAVLTYGELETEEPFETLERAEAWLPEHQEDPTLLLACGRLAARAELYGKARSYLETSIAIRPRLEAYQLLASLMDQLGDRERAIKALNDALALAVGRRPNLPRIRTRRWVDRRQGERRGT